MQLIRELVVKVLNFLAIFQVTEKICPTSKPSFAKDYDYIVVGAGSAGSVVANRLSEDADVTVLLLEAGGCPPGGTEVPLYPMVYHKTDIDWDYKTVTQKNAGFALENRQIPLTRGKCFGGSSVLNTMLYIRGNKKDYDRWEKNGATGWSWNDVFPYFLKSEDNRNKEFVTNGYHGTGGYLTVSKPTYDSKVTKAFRRAGAELGYKYRDVNAERQTGFVKLQGTIRNGARCSTAKAFLVQAENRPNLDIISYAFATEVLFDREKRARAVRFDKDGHSYVVEAKREIILSAGAINTPQLLMLSGIGPRRHLQSLGIPIIADLPVGYNLQDHFGTPLNFLSNADEALLPFGAINPVNVDNYTVNHAGPLTVLGGVTGLAFTNSEYANSSNDYPDLEIYLTSGTLSSDAGLIIRRNHGMTNKVFLKAYLPYAGKPTFALTPSILRSRSRGTLRLKSTNPYDHPLIDPQYYSDPQDVKILVSGLKFCIKIIETKAFKDIGATLFKIPIPSCKRYWSSYHPYSDSYLECLVKALPFTIYHYMGTCKMGRYNDTTTVVDPRLRVKEVTGLRVVDGSVIPTYLSGNINAPIIMIGEKASDMIKEDRRRGRY